MRFAQIFIFMPKSKEQKEKIIEGLKEKLQKQKSVVFVDFSGCDSKFLFKLRDELEKSNCLLRVAKKTLLKKTLETLTMKDISGKIDEIKLQLALIFGFADEIAPFKISYQFSKENENLIILGGILGKEFLAKEKIIELAQLPSREEVLARFTGSLASPISGFVNILKGNLKGLIYTLSAIKESK